MGYSIKPKADADIEGIWVYTLDHWTREQADKYRGLIMEEVLRLTTHPFSGKDYSHVKKGYRCSKVVSHLIIYRIKGNDIEIVRVLHQRMDIPNRLRG